MVPPNAPMALVLHPHPPFGGTMNNPLVYDLFHMFPKLGCPTVRFNFRGVGRSQGMFEDRIQNVIREVKERPNLILFVDEAHTLVGAGSALGAPSDAAHAFQS